MVEDHIEPERKRFNMKIDEEKKSSPDAKI